MKTVVSLFIYFLAILPCFGQKNLYDFSVELQNGKQISLSDESGKIVWIVLLPVMQTSEDSAFLKRIDSLSRTYSDRMVTLAVPSFDDGYSPRNNNKLLRWYQAVLNDSIYILKPSFTHKTADSQQNSLSIWLTNASMNSVFDEDVPGPGSSFFIDTRGNLYGRVSAAGRFSNKVFMKVIDLD